MESKNSIKSSNNTNDHNDVTDTLAPDASFFDKPKNVKIILNSFYAICILLVALDFVVHRHIYLYFEELPTFYALYGFVACVVLVVLAKLMRLFLMRGEHYYDERLDEAPRIDCNEVTETNDGLPVVSKENIQNMDDLGLSTYSGDKE